ncbi:MAG: lytic murein transglycosylase [Ignavibacteria bacterium]|nr:lytic murein transglycosylase [Ignavibacteria bacterium]
MSVLTVNEPPHVYQGDDRAPSQEIGVTHLSRAARIARQHGVDSTFVASLLRTPQTAFNDRFVRINVTNYAQKTDYSHNYNDLGVRKVREFVDKHDSILTLVDSVYSVPPEVIASLLWVESKHGTVLGKYHVASVYLSVLLSCEPEFLEQNTASVMSSMGLDSTKLDSVQMVVERKAVKKVAWAADQLKALAEIDKRGTLNPYTLQGSWAGAFGMTQFLPSSYLSWAVDGDKNGAIDLNDLDDAIFSVANYLKTNGWGRSTTQQRAAVFHYNNSQAYVDAVLTLAQRSRPRPDAPPR